MSSTSSLLRPLLVPDSGWFLSLYPSAGEAGGSFRYSVRPKRSAWVRGMPAADPERSRAEAGRRARGQVRRYCTAHRLNRLGTLTYRGQGCHDPVQLRADVGQFFRVLRRDLGGAPFPYLWVPEWHHTDHGLHVHFAVGQFVPRKRIEDAWGRGFIHIKRLSDLPVGSTSLHESRRAAGYLAKYVAKTFDAEDAQHLKGLHRYEVGQGFQPLVTRLRGVSPEGVLASAVEVMGAAPSRSWSSAEVEDWKAPPALWFQWG